MKITIVKACCDLGLVTTGSQNGPLKITRMDNKVDKVSILHTDKVKKETDPNNKVKNIKPLNKFNKKLYNKIVKDNNFVITLGGDHSIAIGSILASAKKHKNMGIIWIDAHSDYHTVDSTISGNIHGMPLCTVNGQNGYVLNEFFDGEFVSPNRTVLIGPRDVEKPEFDNMNKSGAHMFSTQDVRTKGLKTIMDKTYDLLKTCDSIHISLDIDSIDPEFVPGVSTPAGNGLTLEEIDQILDYILNKKELLSSIDIVELNPLKDKNNITAKLCNNILEKIVTQLKKNN